MIKGEIIKNKIKNNFFSKRKILSKLRNKEAVGESVSRLIISLQNVASYQPKAVLPLKSQPLILWKSE